MPSHLLLFSILLSCMVSTYGFVPSYISRAEKTCQDDTECKDIINSKCNQISKKCKCLPGSSYNADFTKCIPGKLDMACEENTDCSLIMNSEYKLDMACEVNEDCSRIPHADCNDKQLCKCTTDYTDNGDHTQCLAGKLGLDCVMDAECGKILNSRCDAAGSNMCVCVPDTIVNAPDNTKCIPEYLGMACTADEDCMEILNSQCSAETKTCICISDSIPDAYKRKCIPGKLQMPCVKNEDCSWIVNAECIENICKCGSGYIPAGNNDRCDLQNTSFCGDDMDCRNNLTHWCNESGLCGCRVGYEDLGDNCVAPLNKPCTSDEGCIDPNAECIDYRCNCRSGSVAEGGRCVDRHGTHIHLHARGNGDISVELDIDEN